MKNKVKLQITLKILKNKKRIKFIIFWKEIRRIVNKNEQTCELSKKFINIYTIYIKKSVKKNTMTLEDVPK